ncbi:MAG: acyl-CoA thioesterase [Planctomycetes bacterium]|nr:acyl-CoA thioesterase [Planctomycetota bacterium]
MPAIYEHRLSVRASAIDRFGHANNQVYLAWLMQAAEAHSTAQGWPLEAYEHLGAGWFVRKHEIEYLRPALAGDELIVRTWVATLEKVTSLRRYEILRGPDAEKLAVASTNWVFVDFAKQSPCRIPEEVARSFEVVVSA